MLEGGEKARAGRVEGKDNRAVLVLGFDRGAKACEGNAVTRPQPLGRAAEGKPSPAAQIADQQGFDRDILPSGRAATHAPEPRRDHPGVVEDQKIAAAQQRGQVAHRAVVQSVGCDVEQSRSVARCHRPLGYELVGKVEVEEIHAHLEQVQYDAVAEFSTWLAAVEARDVD